jgi:hypothetical protein
MMEAAYPYRMSISMNRTTIVRLERILMMVYVVQNYLASFGLYRSSLRNVVVFCKSSTYQMMDIVQKKPNSPVGLLLS